MRDALTLLGDAVAGAGTDRVLLRRETVAAINPLQLRGADGEPVTVQHTTDWQPRVGDQVLTIRVGAAVWAIGPVTPTATPPATGIVASVSGSLVTVALGAPWGSAAIPSTVTVTTGQRVAIVWQRDGADWSGFVAGVIQTNPAPPPPPPPPPPSGSDGRGADTTMRPLTIRAIDTATWRNGWRGDTDNLYQGNAGQWSSIKVAQRGFWFYGAGAADDHRNRTCESITIRVRVMTQAGVSGPVPVRFRLHTAPTRPTGMPTLLSNQHTVSLAPGTHDVELHPSSMGQPILDGQAAGVAIVADATSEYRGIHGRTADAMSGHLTITTT